MVNAYGQDVDKMVEDWQARLWEELNADDSRYHNWQPAISKMREAVSLLYQASSKLEKATEWTEDTWAENRIASLAEEIDRITGEVNRQIVAMERDY